MALSSDHVYNNWDSIKMIQMVISNHLFSFSNPCRLACILFLVSKACCKVLCLRRICDSYLWHQICTERHPVHDPWWLSSCKNIYFIFFIFFYLICLKKSGFFKFFIRINILWYFIKIYSSKIYFFYFSNIFSKKNN